MKTTMTNDELVDVFLGWQHHLHIVDNRVQLGRLKWTDFETITRLCHLVEAIGDADRSATGRALQRLALTTAAVITTVVVDAPDNAQIVSAWRSARDTYTALTG